MVKKDLMRFLPVFALLIIFALSSGAHPLLAQTSVSATPSLAPGDYRWLEEGPFDGPLYLIISIERQMVHVYSGDRLVGMASVSTGTKGHRTPTGEYPILQKREWHRSNIYSNAPMPFMQRLTWDGIALHAGHNPGYPASHGCIRLPHAFARKLFGVTQLGTEVVVTRDAPGSAEEALAIAAMAPVPARIEPDIRSLPDPGLTMIETGGVTGFRRVTVRSL